MIDLANCMREQLDVFLAAETVPFLERLFAAIHSGEYMKPIDASVQQKQSIENALNNNPGVNKSAIRYFTPPIEDKTFWFGKRMVKPLPVQLLQQQLPHHLYCLIVVVAPQ